MIKKKTIKGIPRHYIVGIIVERNEKYLLLERINFPYGFACPAGHVDEGETIKEAMNRGLGIMDACKAAGINHTTLWTWRRKDPKLEAYITKLLMHRTERVIDALYRTALKGNTAAQVFWLKNNAGWKDSPIIDQSQHEHYVLEIIEDDPRKEKDSDFTIQQTERDMESWKAL